MGFKVLKFGIILLSVWISICESIMMPSSDCSESGNPLFLTPFIESGEIAKARLLSRVSHLPLAPPVTSYSGLLTVNKRYNTNLFFWFFPAMNGDKRAPVLLWLQGGPGLTGLFGLFTEHGPYHVHPNLTLGLREYAWTQSFQVIYVDNPAGTGFSFTEDNKGYVTNEEEMATDMYEFLLQFFAIFHEYRRNEFYIAGESYGGKYVPALAHKIHEAKNSSKINLKGISVGNGMCDPETMMDYGDYLYQLGLVDRQQASMMRKLSKSIVRHIRKKEYYKALIEMDKLIIDLNVLPYNSYFKNYTDYKFYYNFLMTKTPEDFERFREYVVFPEFRKAVHVGNLTFQDGKKAQKHLLTDIMKSVKDQVAVIMDNYRVLFFNGQLDLIIPYPLTVNFLSSIRWKYAQEYKNAERLIWTLDNGDEIAGYVHNVKDFYEVMVRNAGHVVPYDQPRVAFDLISRFLLRKPYDSKTFH
ncbi:putative serine carboxypeptidase CPVL, partial [Stegodyphus mimosarum]